MSVERLVLIFLFISMLNDKHGPIGKALQGIQPQYRETSFMAGQLGRCPGLTGSTPQARLTPSLWTVYSLVFMLPAATFLIKSPNSCIVFLLFVFGVSVSRNSFFASDRLWQNRDFRLGTELLTTLKCLEGSKFFLAGSHLYRLINFPLDSRKSSRSLGKRWRHPRPVKPLSLLPAPILPLAVRLPTPILWSTLSRVPTCLVSSQPRV